MYLSWIIYNIYYWKSLYYIFIIIKDVLINI